MYCINKYMKIPDFSELEGFEWDLGNLEHIKKHKVSSEECEQVFVYSEVKVSKDIKHSFLEERYKAFGTTLGRRSLAVIFTIRENKLRVLTARDQSKKERGDVK